MNQPELAQPLKQLFLEAEKAHQEAFAETGGEDPDWPLWYARYLHEPLQSLLGREFAQSRLVFCFMKAAEEHEAVAPEEDWTDFCTHHFLDCYGASETPAEDRLALYYTPICPFCLHVLNAVRKLDVEIELRNTITNPPYRDELIEARGRATVPVLWIQSPSGEVRWMPESLDIIEYLVRTYGNSRTG